MLTAVRRVRIRDVAFRSLPFILVCTTILSACSTSTVDRQRNLEVLIDSTVNLPDGAADKSRYSRYYAENNASQIEVLYVIHTPQFVSEVENFCRAGGSRRFPCRASTKESELAPAGEGVWLQNPDELPIPEGAGCGAITFTYNPRDGTSSAPTCNGAY